MKTIRSGKLTTLIDEQYVEVRVNEGSVFYSSGMPITVRIPDFTICSIPRQYVGSPELLGRDSLLGMLYREEFRGTTW